jgi:peptide/nickel transport system substrate-binding protein
MRQRASILERHPKIQERNERTKPKEESMSKFVSLAIVAILIAGIAAGCAQPTPAVVATKPAAAAATAAPVAPAAAPTAAPAATKPAAVAPTATAVPAPKVKRGGTLRDINIETNDSLDPHLASSRSAPERTLIYDTLLQYRLVDAKTEKFEIAPGLAEEYKMVNPTTWELKLRKNVKFHDGSGFNAAVAKWNLERANTHPKSLVKQSGVALDQIEVVDDYTLRLKLKAPVVTMALYLTPAPLEHIAIVSKEAVEKLGDEQYASNPSGTGPFKLRQWVRDERLVLDKFPGHWQQGADGQPLPYVDGYNSRYITDYSVALLEVRAGNMDLFTNLELKDVATVRANPEMVVQEIAGSWRGLPSLYFNPRPETNSPFTKNKKLREAALFALDREGMAKALGFGIAKPHYYPFWFPGNMGYDDKNPKREFSLAKAKALLVESGQPEASIDIKVINRSAEVRAVETVQAMLTAAGLKATVTAVDRLPWIADGKAGKFEALSHRADGFPDPQLMGTITTGAPGNYAGYANPEVDKLWAQAGAEYDDAKRADIYRKIQSMIYEDAYHVTGYMFTRMAVMNKAVKGFSTHYNQRDIWFDK